MKMIPASLRATGGLAVALLVGGAATEAVAALLAYEPFTNAPGAALIGSADGYGFSAAWQLNSSQGTATNTTAGLGYTDGAGNVLLTSGGAGFFQGLTTANSSMQANRPFNFTRATNGEAATTWISLLLLRQGPTNGTTANPYPRGVNVTFDYPDSSIGANQRLGVGNSSGASTNTVGLLSAGGNLRPSANPPYRYGGGFGPYAAITNLVVLRIDHIAGVAQQANDNAYLWVNPNLAIEPALNTAATNVLGLFDYSIGLVRVFVGGQDTANNRPYGELVVDEIRVGETYADVTPLAPTNPPAVTGALLITNVAAVPGGVLIAGTGGVSGQGYVVCTATNLDYPLAAWSRLGTNAFDVTGSFRSTNPASGTASRQYFRVLGGVPLPVPVQPPNITTQPVSQTVFVSQSVTFSSAVTGSAPLRYQWFFNGDSVLAGVTNSAISLVNVQPTNAGTYFFVVTNSAGVVTSSPAVLTVNQFPAITVQPTNRTAPPGTAVAFNVAALGTAPLRYQWYFNSTTPLANATNAGLILPSVSTNDVGSYLVIITNGFGGVTSTPATLTVTASLLAGAYFVSGDAGNDANAGTEANPFKTIAKGLSMIASGGTVYVRAGTYSLPSKLSLSGTGGSAANPKRLWAYPGEFPVIDSTGNSSDGVGISGRFYHLKGLTVMKAGHNGINISGNSNTVEFCTVRENGNTGLHLTGSAAPGPSYNLILNCDAVLNYDPPIGGNADGFSAKWDIGPGNVFRGCRAWWNSDDGWDLWMATSPVLIENCWAFWSGTNYWADPQFNGNGNGFKLGGNYVGTPHRLVRSLAFVNEANGIDQNNNEEGQTIDNNTGWGNKTRNFNLNHGTNSTPHLVRNNLSFAGVSADSFRSGTIFSNNSWQVLSPAPGSGDVLSVSPAGVTGPRQADGSLPVLNFLRPVPGGRLIDKGVDLGDPFAGLAPELGAFEFAP